MPRYYRSGGFPSHCTRAYTSVDDDLMADKPGSPIPFTASTPGVKRDGMDLRSDGWRLDRYRAAGGPVLWNHDHTIPSIGSGEAKSEPKRLRIAVRFDQEDPLARSIESKLRRKFLRASSVGWDFTDGDGRPLNHRRLSSDYLRRGAYYELTEHSIVNVPADPSAVAERSMLALRRVSPVFAGLYEDQERYDSDVTADELLRAVEAECTRQGLDLATLLRGQSYVDIPDEDDEEADEDESDDDESATNAGLARNHDPETRAVPDSPVAPAPVDTRAVSDLLAAFPLFKGAS